MTTHTSILLLLVLLACGCRRGPASMENATEHSTSSSHMIDPGRQFKKSFEMVDRIEFVIRVSGQEPYLRNVFPRPKEFVATISDQDDIKRLFECIAFVPYPEGSSCHIDSIGDPIVRGYSNNTKVGEFEVLPEYAIRWSPLATDAHLTPESRIAVKTYLDEKVYSVAIPKHEPELPKFPLRTDLPNKTRLPQPLGQPTSDDSP